MDKIIKKPEITVLMPMHNGENYIKEAVESILRQTFKDFEFLIINDGSTDKSAEIIKSFKDKRIKYVSNVENKGLPFSLNRGLELAEGEYVARMDCDDISLPKRLEKQIAFMKSRNGVAVCGTRIKTIGDKRGYVNKLFTDHDDIRASLLFNTSLAHPSVMIRKSFLDKFRLRYDEKYLHFEDYALWVELSRRGLLANLPKVLLLYRLHKSSVSNKYSLGQKEGAHLIRRNQLERLGLKLDEEEIRIHNSFRPKEDENISDFLEKEERWLSKIMKANDSVKIYNQDSLAKIIYIRWKTICGMNAEKGIMVWKKFIRSPLFKTKNQNRIWDSAKLLIKCIV